MKENYFFESISPTAYASCVSFSYRSMVSSASFLRGCGLNSVFEVTVSNIFGKQILTIILVSVISHIIIFVFHKINGIYYSFRLTLKLIIQSLSCSSIFMLIESINHRKELFVASIYASLRNYVWE